MRGLKMNNKVIYYIRVHLPELAMNHASLISQVHIDIIQ